MGRLVGLELHNFKSYKGTTSVGFGTAQFTSIIGPNGSGKSNMMDAISFVLGVRTNQLRSSQLKDLIYRGSRIEEEQGQEAEQGEAEAEQGEEGDPDRAYVLALYEKSNGETLNLKRTITARGNSEYRVNNKKTTYNEFSSLLKEENILIKAKNFLVFQGDVEQIASQSASELSKMIETISGSGDLKREYEVLKDQQDQAKQETSAMISKRRTLMSEVKQYKEQCREAELYQVKIEEKNQTIQSRTLWKLYHIDQKQTTLDQSIDDTKTKLKTIKQEITKKESTFKSLKSQYAKELLKIEKFKKNITSKRLEIHGKKNELLPLQVKKESTAKKISALLKRVKEISADAERQTQYVKDVERQIKVVTKVKQTTEAQFKAKNKATGKQISEEDQKEYESLRQQYLSGAGGSAEEEALALLKDELNEIESSLAQLQTQKNINEERVVHLQTQRNELKEKLTTISNELNELNDQISKKKHSIKSLKKASEDFFNKDFELNTKLRSTLLKLDDLSANQRETHREVKLRENVNTLKRLFPGVIGLLNDLVHPKQKKYELALSTILGKNFDSIIVETSAVAHQCIAYLKEQRSGVASFIPLDTIEAQGIDSRLRHMDSKCRPTIDVVEYEQYLERAVQFACGNSLVCDDIQTARDIRWERNVDVKVVTLDGSLIHKAGLMTGGKSKNGSERRWNKNEVQDLTKIKDDLLFKLRELHQSKPNPIEIKNLEFDLVNLETQVSVIRRHRSELERSIHDADAEIKYHTEDNDREERRVQGKIRLEDIQQKISSQEAVIAKKQRGIFKDFCSKFGFKSIKEYEDTTQSQVRAQSKELKQFNTELLKLNKKLDFEKERLNDTTVRLTKLKADIDKSQEILKEVTEEIETIKNQLDVSESSLELYQTDLKDFEKTVEVKLAGTKNEQEELNELQDKKDQCQRQLEIGAEDKEKVLIEKIAILKNCKIESISVPFLSKTSLKDLPLDSDENLIDLVNELEVDYKSLDQRHKDINNSKISQEFEDQLEEINKTLSQLSPNVKAIDRLSEVSSSLETLEAEFQEIRAHELNIVKSFQDIKQQRYDLFMTAFNHIAAKIDPIYKELTNPQFSTSMTLGGGSAYLTLEDEDEPYLSGIRYHAMPPMKRFKDMEFLSGGEKTIAALSLLFAIHSFIPSPFFVLDEVDAALDNGNVAKIAKYILNHCSVDFQFIVISLKNSLFEKSDSLVGIYRDKDDNCSKTITLDLRTFDEAGMANAGAGAVSAA
ncbi:hypothetical protein WICPIJ_003962 [Wickerhamomyces pijperi]|uniref:Structural maintenance of chromosomes protein n=1 Tax=Wickerhamomyces pijperi TaxID=599730 RepID=A0A9P8TND7_WICPI|nr:hypothetical protein WICPIJ_003962 [Wickerhamomyces pijperi]